MNYVLVTIDTEGPEGIKPVEKLIWGYSADGDAYGIDYIMDICDEYKIRALFFVDIAEAWDCGIERISQVMQHIKERGHIVGVHIHPDRMADKDRLFLFEYSLEEQREIIKKCTDLYIKVLGTFPMYFRAGKYSANYDTLQILDEMGYKYDYSSFWGQRWCGLKPAFTADRLCRYNGLIEVPVTSFKAIDTPFLKRYDKIDVEMVFTEFCYVMNRLVERDENVISLFLHSFSFLKWRKNVDSPDRDSKTIKKFRKMLNYCVSEPNIKLIDADELDNLICSGKLLVPPVGNDECQVKIKNIFVSYVFLLLTAIRIKEYNKKARALVFVNCCVYILIFLMMIFILF